VQGNQYIVLKELCCSDGKPSLHIYGFLWSCQWLW